MTHFITACSGIGLGKECRVISWSHPSTKCFQHDYPFVGGRTPQSMRWVAVQFADGSIDTFPANRVRPLQHGGAQ